MNKKNASLLYLIKLFIVTSFVINFISDSMHNEIVNIASNILFTITAFMFLLEEFLNLKRGERFFKNYFIFSIAFIIFIVFVVLTIKSI